MTQTIDFIIESNLIEGIDRFPSEAEIEEHERFINLPVVTVKDLVQFVSIYQPNAQLRNKAGLNVRIGHHIPPAGSPDVENQLKELLDELELMTQFEVHCLYEMLHPFTDGNGRSGRALWAWHMVNTVGGYPLGFLHHFYYQSLEASRE